MPSRSIGFVKVGQQVWISYDAFPQQKFGKYAGTVRAISVTPVDPQDLPVGRRQKLFPTGSSEEPLYRVDIEMAEQSILVADQRRPLIPGMSIAVDLIQERRSMIEWIFEPMLRLKHRMEYDHA